MAEDFGVQGRGAFYDETGTIRDVVQNHLFQVLTNLAMEPPVAHGQRIDPGREGQGPEGHAAARARRTSCAGSSAATGRSQAWPPDSKMETFAALRLDINSWRWQGVPFYIRAGKCLPVTCTEVVVRLRQPPTMYQSYDLKPNYCPAADQSGHHHRHRRQRRSRPESETDSVSAEMLASRHPGSDEMDAYERVLGDAMAGDRHALRPRGLRRGGVAYRRSRDEGGHARVRVRAGDLGAEGGRAERDASRRMAESRGDGGIMSACGAAILPSPCPLPAGAGSSIPSRPGRGAG